jgi:translation initiation factor 3 subunit C
MECFEEKTSIFIAAHEFDARRRMISKTFYQQLRSSERQSLVGPPESMREHVVAASKAMRNGNWSACKNFIINEKMNAKVRVILILCVLFCLCA